MTNKGNISEQVNKMSVEKAGFTYVGEYGTVAMVWTGTTVITSGSLSSKC